MSPIPASDKYGPSVTGHDVENAAIATMKLWLKGYMHNQEDKEGVDRDTYPGVKSWSTHSTFDALPGDDLLPMIVVVSPGLSGQPVKDGEGFFRATWTIGVAVVVSSGTSEFVRRLVMRYAAAIRLCLTQKRDLGGLSRGVVWLDEGYDDIPADADRSIMAARLYFDVEVDEVAQAMTGPLHPDEDGNWPIVQPPVDIHIEREAV